MTTTTPPSSPSQQPHHGPAAGWYPDPAGSGGTRWWDGVGWTTHLRGADHPTNVGKTLLPPPPATPAPAAQPVVAPPPPSAPSYPGTSPASAPAPYAPYYGAAPDYRTHLKSFLIPREIRGSIWAQRALVLLGITMLGHGVLGLLYRTQLARIFHWIHQSFTLAEHGNSANLPAAPVSTGAYASWSDLDNLALVIALILFFIWQYRAANAARHLGLPSRIAPGVGILLWIIPIVNLVAPAFVFADLLPKGHPSRRSLVLLWAAFEIGSILSVVVYVLAPYHHVVAAALLGFDALIWIWVVTEGIHLIRVVTHVHSELANR